MNRQASFISALEKPDSYVELMHVTDPEAFGCLVCDDSMLPDYADGDTVIFSPSTSPRDGDACFVVLDDGTRTFRYVTDITVDMLTLCSPTGKPGKPVKFLACAPLVHCIRPIRRMTAALKGENHAA